MTAVLAGFVVLLALGPSPAAATAEDQNSLQSITPADGESVETSPEAIVLSFNQELDDDDALTLTLACNNQPQETGIPEVGPDALVVTVEIVEPLPRGTCPVSWVLRNGLGEQIVAGQSTFAVLQDPPAANGAGVTTTTSEFISVPAVTTASTDNGNGESQGSIGGAIWFGRLLSTLGILVVFGGLALISVGWPEGPEYVVTVRFLRAAWLLSLAGTVLYLIAFAADFGGVSFGSAVSPSTWLDLNDAGWEGRGALLRLVFIGASGWVAIRPERIIDPTSAMWAWAIPGVALLAVAMSRIDGPAALVGYFVNVFHVLAAAIWFGGAALVARVVLAGPGEEDLVQATRAFSRVSVPAMLVVSITGVIQVIRLDGGELFTSSHGRVVLLKVIAVAAMLAVAIAVRQQIAIRLDRAHEMTPQLADRFRRAFHAEAAIGVVVLAFSGWLLQLTPPNIDPLDDEVYIDPIPFNDETSGIEARVFIGPGEAGPTGLKVEVEEPPEGITSLRLRFVPPEGTEAPAAYIVEQPIPLSGSGTAVLDDSVGLPLNVPGTWTLQLFASTSTGVIDGAERTFALTDAEGNFVTIPPTESTVDVSVSVIDQSTTTAPFASTTTTTTTTTP